MKPSNSIKKSKKYRKLLYLLTAAVIVFWCLIFVNSFWQNNLQKTGSFNNGLVVDAKNRLADLSGPIVIEPGQTSGNANPLIATYLSAQKKLADSRPQKPNLARHGFYYFLLNSNNNKATYLISSAGSELDAFINIITDTHKFLEYNPAADLANLQTGQPQDSAERLNRTKIGLEETINKINGGNYQNKQQIAAEISPLASKAVDVNPDNLNDWLASVYDAQESIIRIINTDFATFQSNTTTQLQAIASQYLQ